MPLTLEELNHRLDAAVAAGAARFPEDPKPPKKVRTYDPKDVKVTFNGVELKGFADGAFIEVEREVQADARNLRQGILSPNEVRTSRFGGEISVTLLAQGSGIWLDDPHNDTKVDREAARRWWADFTGYDWLKFEKLTRRRILRARMRARKQRRGW